MRGDSDLIDNKAVGKRIREIRKSNKLTQEELAEILDVTPNAIRDYERGSYGISKNVMALFRKNFRVSVDYLLLGEEGEWEHLALLLENVSEEHKMRALLRLVFYFVREKKRSFGMDAGSDGMEDIMKNVLGDMR